MTQPVPLHEKEMDSSIWKHWVEHVRTQPTIELRPGNVVARYTASRSSYNPISFTISAPFDGPMIVRANIGMVVCTANGETLFSYTGNPYEPYPQGLYQFVIENVLAGQTIYMRDEHEYYGDMSHHPTIKNAIVSLEQLPSVMSRGTVRLPPHPRLKTNDRRWVDHWNGVYHRIGEVVAASGMARGCDYGHYAGTTSLSSPLSVAATKSGPCFVMAHFNQSWVGGYSSPASTFSLRKGGVAMRTFTQGAGSSIDYGQIFNVYLSEIGECAEGDVFDITRSWAPSAKVSVALSIWHT